MPPRRGDPYVIAVLDMCMPDMDGVELAGLVSADRALAASRLIMLSSAIGADQDELERVGLREWLSKPVRNSEFFNRLMRMTAKWRPTLRPRLHRRALSPRAHSDGCSWWRTTP